VRQGILLTDKRKVCSCVIGAPFTLPALQVYAGSRSLGAWNERLPNTSSAAAPGSGKPLLLAVPSLQAPSAQGQWYIIWAAAGTLQFYSASYAASYAPLRSTGAGVLTVPAGITVADAMGPRATLLHVRTTHTEREANPCICAVLK
jgi:hypothetical protein